VYQLLRDYAHRREDVFESGPSLKDNGSPSIGHYLDRADQATLAQRLSDVDFADGIHLSLEFYHFSLLTFLG
jgi:hypothetical protein